MSTLFAFADKNSKGSYSASAFSFKTPAETFNILSEPGYSFGYRTRAFLVTTESGLIPFGSIPAHILVDIFSDRFQNEDFRLFVKANCNKKILKDLIRMSIISDI